ncbi:MAG: hypothetical protein JKY27_07055, partial [Magnetovibrio sp.]|nr:hypothetical protein [Magnetovibrio sp.]
PDLPPGISQDDINAAIAQVQQTGSTDGIAQNILSAACTQIEAQAVAQGIDISAIQNASAAPQQDTPAPTTAVEAAVLDKQSTFDNFAEQRDSMREAVASQREAMQQPYKDALAKVGGKAGANSANAITPEQMSQLASAMQGLDPDTMALVNVLSMVSANPSLLNSVVWIEIIRTIRHQITKEVQKQVQLALHTQAT